MWVFKCDLSVITLIGLVLLVGIVKKNAIMMVDVALGQQREQKLGAYDAIFKASLLRFRPIMMTTMCALLGAIPLVISNGAGSELRRPLGVAVIGGLRITICNPLHGSAHIPDHGQNGPLVEGHAEAS